MYSIYYPSGKITDSNGVEVLPGAAMDSYVAWLAAPNSPTVISDPMPKIIVTAWQIRKALNQVGHRAAVENAISSSSDQDLKDGWACAENFESDNPIVLSMQSAFGMTAAQMYSIFQIAEGL